MKLKNPFSNETRQLFWEARYCCFLCGGNGANRGGIELHHVFGRCSSSPLNAATLCHSCHSHVRHVADEHKMLTEHTITYLRAQGYEWTEEDKAFYEKEIKPLSVTMGRMRLPKDYKLDDTNAPTNTI